MCWNIVSKLVHLPEREWEGKSDSKKILVIVVPGMIAALPNPGVQKPEDSSQNTKLDQTSQD